MKENFLIECRNVRIVYKNNIFYDRIILENVSFAVQKNACIAIMGENGAGKSTLLRLMAGLITHTDGSVVWHSTRIGYVPENTGLPYFLTAREFLTYLVQLTHKNYEIIDELLLSVGLLDQAHQKISAFSRGMKQRLLIVQAMLNNPDLLILDEPFSGIDKQSWKYIESLCFDRSIPRAIVYATHERPVAQTTEILLVNSQQVIPIKADTAMQDLRLQELMLG